MFGVATGSDGYIKPHTQGPPEEYGQSPYSFGGRECRLEAAFQWEWHHPDGRYGTTVTGTPLVDADLNIYISSIDGVRKLSIDGDVLWSWSVPNLTQKFHAPKAAAIIAGKVVGTLTSGEAFALDMATGGIVWRVLVDDRGIGGDTGFVSGLDGRVLIDVVSPRPPNVAFSESQMNEVVALDVANGRELWRHKPRLGAWNFHPMYPRDGTALYQSWTGGAYRINLTDGNEIWSSGILDGDMSFTDGGPALSPDGIFYTVVSKARAMKASDSGKGAGGILAWNVSDGALIWNVSGLEQGIYSWPALGRTSEGAGRSLVVTVGSLGSYPLRLQLQVSAKAASFLSIVFGLLAAILWAVSKEPSAPGFCGRRFGRSSLVVVAALLAGPLLPEALHQSGVLERTFVVLSGAYNAPPACVPLFVAAAAATAAGAWLLGLSQRRGNTTIRGRVFGPAAWCCLWRPAILVTANLALMTVAFPAFFGKWRYNHSVQSFDAASGRLQWRLELPTYFGFAAAGDEAGALQRQAAGVRDICLPAASSAYTMDAQGAVYFGHMDGRLYKIKDWNGDGNIDFDSEVCSYDTKTAGLVGSPTIAPGGYLIYAGCDGLYVFRDSAGAAA